MTGRYELIRGSITRQAIIAVHPSGRGLKHNLRTEIANEPTRYGCAIDIDCLRRRRQIQIEHIEQRYPGSNIRQLSASKILSHTQARAR